MKWPKWLKNNEYAKTAIILIIILVAVFGFQFGIRAALRTSYPLAAVESGSMEPTLKIGDLIIVQGISNASQIKVGPNPEGDIIVFYEPGGGTKTVYWFFKQPDLIVHRAIAEEYNSTTHMWYFETKGDANPVPDQVAFGWGWIPQNMIVGRVVGHVGYLGEVSMFMQSTNGMYVIIFLFCALLIWAIFFPEKKSSQPEERTSLYKEPP